MLKTKALSPEVKDLFQTVSGQADLYKSAYAQIERHLQWATSEKTTLQKIQDDLPKKLDDTIEKLSNMVEEYIAQVSDKSSRAVKIGEELETIDRYKEDMQRLRAQLQNKMVDLKKAVTDFQHRSDVELKKVLETLQEKINTELAKEAEKVEVRLAVKSKKIEGQVNVFEQKSRRVIDRIRLETKQMVEETTNNAKEIRLISGDIQDFKELITPRLKEQQDFLKKMKKRYDAELIKLDERIDKVMAMGVSGTGAQVADPLNPQEGLVEDAIEDPDGIFASYDPNKKIDKNKPLNLDAAPKKKTADEKIEELHNIIEEEKKKTNAALILAGLSILGVLSLVVLAVL
jgi:hypothetical protein